MVNTWALQRNERLINSDCDCASHKFSVSCRVIDKALFKKTVWTPESNFYIRYVTVVFYTNISWAITFILLWPTAWRSGFRSYAGVSLIVYPLSSLFCLNMHAVEERSYSQGSVTRERAWIKTELAWTGWCSKRRQPHFPVSMWFEEF